ncbi:MAG: hypothetical protein ACOY3P_00360 [Planctomycetota bacterium]
MSALIDDQLVQRDPAAILEPTAADRLRATMIAVRVSLQWLGVRKTLSPEQRAEAADTFGAEQTFLSAGKKLLDTRHPAYKAVTAVRGRIVSLWRAMSLPYPEPGIRLIRQDRVNEFDLQMRTLREELAEAVEALDRRYEELKLAARERLGRLFNQGDYPDSLRQMFAVGWDYPSVEPPAYLQQLSPALYEEECQRVRQRFDEAVQLAESAFTEELARLVSHLTERLSGSDDGRPKIFRDSAVENLQEFFGRFRELNVRSSAELDRLVGDCQRVVQGVGPQLLRDNQGLRQQVATELSRVQSVLDGLLVDRPRRNILRRPR